MRLSSGASAEHDALAAVAYIEHTTRLEVAETGNASFWECFKGTNLWRTEIVSKRYKRHKASLTPELRGLGRSDPVRQRDPRLLCRVFASCRILRRRIVQCEHCALLMLHYRRHHLLVL